ncbi:MAG: iron-sulfur cluster assembly scaffold protein [Azospirillaceae bacterium]
MSDALYQARIVAAARQAREPVLLEDASAEAMVDNPLCGDRVTVQFDLDADGRIERVGHKVRGCLLCQAAMALLAAKAPGLPASGLAVVRDAVAGMIRQGGPVPEGWPELDIFEPVRAVRSRHECVILPFEAAARAAAGDS